MRAKVAGTWRDPQSVNVKVAGAWKQATDGYTKVGGAWKAFAVRPFTVSYASGDLSEYQSSPTATITATGGNPNVAPTYSLSGTLPTGCSFNTSTGTITGPRNWDIAPQAIGPHSMEAAGPNGSMFLLGYRSTYLNPFGAYLPYGGATYPAATGASSQPHFVKMDASGNFVWATGFGAATNRQVTIIDLAATPDGGLVVAGHLLADGSGSVVFGSTTLTPATQFKGFLAKIAADGAWSWVREFPTTTTSLSLRASVASDGSIYTAIQSTGTVTINGTGYATAGQSDVHLAKYDSSGVFQWVAPKIGSAGSQSIFNIHAATDGVVVVGTTSDTVTIGGASVGVGIFIAKASASNGAWSWALRGGNGNAINLQHSALTTSGNVLVGGNFSTSTTFGSTNLTSSGTQDAFFALATSSGAWSWAHRAGTTSTSEFGYSSRVKDVTVPDNPPVFFNSYGNVAPSIGSTSGTARSSGGGTVARINSNGTVAWATGFGGTATQTWIEDVVTVSDGNTIVLGNYLNGTLVAGPSTLTAAPSGSNYRFLAVIAANGTIMGATLLGAHQYTGSSRLFPYGSDSVLASTPMYNQTSALTVGSTVFPAGTFVDSTYGRLMVQYTSSRTLGSATHRGFPATVSIAAQRGDQSSSTSVTLRQKTTRVFGGTRFSDATYYYNVFRQSGSFVVSDANLDVTVLCVGGGGGAQWTGDGASQSSGGGGAGGVLSVSSTLAPGSYAATIGAGGGYAAGSSTTFGSVATALGGGKGGWSGSGPTSGGSGGGGGTTGQSGAAGTSGQGFAGGNANGNGAGGGGGAGQAGQVATSLGAPGAGGNGTQSFSTWTAATGTGDANYLGGGGSALTSVYNAQSQGSSAYVGAGGFGGGGGRIVDTGVRNGFPNTGGGATAMYGNYGNQYSVGGSGLVIVRYLRSAVGG